MDVCIECGSSDVSFICHKNVNTEEIEIFLDTVCNICGSKEGIENESR